MQYRNRIQKMCIKEMKQKGIAFCFAIALSNKIADVAKSNLYEKEHIKKNNTEYTTIKKRGY